MRDDYGNGWLAEDVATGVGLDPVNQVHTIDNLPWTKISVGVVIK